MNASSTRIGNSALWLTGMAIPVLAGIPMPPRVHRLIPIDVSGSMYGDLPAVRRDLKRLIDTKVSHDDTVTILYFSGKGQFGTVVEAASVRSSDDRRALFDAIDRKLVPIGLTGFKEPLEEVDRIIERLSRLDTNAAFSMTFMSDGHDNQWSRNEILKVCETLGSRLASAIVVEYGWYANRPMLVAMAEALGGEYVHAEDAERFLPILDRGLSGKVGGAARREITLPMPPLHAMTWSMSAEGNAIMYAPDAKNAVKVTADTTHLWMLTETPAAASTALGDPRNVDPQVVGAMYAAAAVLSQRMLSDETLAVLAALGDVAMIGRFASCFGKQQYTSFREAVLDAANEPDLRWSSGYDPAALPEEDAFTVLELLSHLSRDGNLLHLSHPSWDYSPIGRKTVFGGDVISADVREELADAVANAARAGDLDAVKAAVEAAQASAVKEYKFNRTASATDTGVPMASLVLHESRPNVSLLTRQEGTLELGADGPAHGLPASLPTFVWRNYAVVRDGILNVGVLPVSLTQEAHASLLAQGLVTGPWTKGQVYVLNLRGMPIVNRRMVRSAVTSANELFLLEWALIKAQTAQKVWKEFESRYAERSRTDGLAALYGETAAVFLKEIGVTDGGFSPKRVVAEVSDVYIGRELKVSIKGFSSVPKVLELEDRLDTGKKLTPALTMMVPYLLQAQAMVAANPDHAKLVTALRAAAKASIEEARRINARLSEIKFAVTVGQVWFKEFSSLDEGTLDMTDDDGVSFLATATLREMEVKI